jgi:MerR family transcriptional regulator/heat shock protein HspR
MDQKHDEPCYVISVAARLLGMHVQTLRYYERAGLIAPSRSRSNVRLYSERDIQRLREVKRLMDDLGVNLAGAEVILRMRDRLKEMEEQREQLNQEIERLKQAVGRRGER